MNPENKVIDAIDALVDWQLAHPEGYGVDDDDCPVCRHDWHGTPEWGCPGAFGSDAEVEAYRIQSELPWKLPDGDPFDVASWLDVSAFEEYRRGFGLVVGAPWTIPALDMNRVIWNDVR